MIKPCNWAWCFWVDLGLDRVRSGRVGSDGHRFGSGRVAQVAHPGNLKGPELKPELSVTLISTKSHDITHIF